MNEVRFAPEEFARLMALVPEHPDRQRLEADPRFVAWRRMFAQFESAQSPNVEHDELREATAALDARMYSVLGGAEAVAAPNAAPPAGGEARHKSLRAEGGWFERWFGGSTLRPALALAATVVAVSGVWWISNRNVDPGLVRGANDRIALTVSVSATPGEPVALSWSAVAGAERYDLVFYGSDLNEIARIEGVTGTRSELRRETLPTGLEHGSQVAVEVNAMKGDAVLQSSKATPLLVP